jgi:hypothetical protein
MIKIQLILRAALRDRGRNLSGEQAAPNDEVDGFTRSQLGVFARVGRRCAILRIARIDQNMRVDIRAAGINVGGGFIAAVSAFLVRRLSPSNVRGPAFQFRMV